ncbi:MULTISPECIES: hypothetical protein [unclassified Myroides]|uniref:hypothetical protein n=1 Tax=unclassified Myroides TaxID=2642485 RepID=UPI003D2F5967
MMLLALLTPASLGTNLASLQAITTMLHLCFGVAFLIVLGRFIRDFFFYRHSFKQAFHRRKAPLFILMVVYIVTMFSIYFLW